MKLETLLAFLTTRSNLLMLLFGVGSNRHEGVCQYSDKDGPALCR